MASKETSSSLPRRTPDPSDWQQTWTLMKRNFHNDVRKKPKLYLMRVFGGPIMWMLYTIGYFLSAEPDTSDGLQVGAVRFFPPEGFVFPQGMYLAGTTNLTTVREELETTWGQQVSPVDTTNETAFQEFCQSTLQYVPPSDQVCVFVESELGYSIYFGGGQDYSVLDNTLVGAQQAVQSSLLTANALEDTYPVGSIQQVPELVVQEERTGASEFYLLFPGGMLTLALAITMQFTMAPMGTEKFKGIIRSFLLVGVKLRVYYQQWVLYLSANAVLTAAVLTAISIGWRLFAESSAGLLFLSHFLALVQMVLVSLLLSQITGQEELMQGLPWLMVFASVAASAGIILLDEPSSIGLVCLTVLSPFVGIMYYTAVYANYDFDGFGVGIHAGDNVAESGLLGCYLSQMVGILVWAFALYWMSRPRQPHKASVASASSRTEGELPAERFEPLPPNADVLLSVQGLSHTYQPRFCQRSKPVNVLNGLDFKVVRGEIFSYLGHNGSGKTTSFGILSGELGMTEGTVEYHFRDGDASLEQAEALTRIRKHIGVCPQHNDSLHGDASCREMLRLFACLKGNVPLDAAQSVDDAIDAEVARRIEELKFTSQEDADKPIDTYSGGMKRKVCIALALLGDPEVVFLDEPSAGTDPYNRRQIWDMIIAAKRGRSIILTTHFLEEADVLGDRVGILKDGHLVTCGSTLFLKHQFGRYMLRFDCPEDVAIAGLVHEAKRISLEGKENSYQWELQHGSEPSFGTALRRLDNRGATNVSLELTSLEQVFLETGQEDEESIVESDGAEMEREETSDSSSDLLRNIWAPDASVCPVSFLRKLLHVQIFMVTNAWASKGIVFLNITMPMIYLVLGMVISTQIENEDGELVDPLFVPLKPSLAGDASSQFFGVPELQGNPIAPIIPTNEAVTLQDYWGNGSVPFLGGYWTGNATLQFNETFSPFAVQIGLQVLGNYTALLTGSTEGMVTQLVQLSYTQEADFRVDTLILPVLLVLGFSGLAFAVLDVLLLKAENVIGLFRVTGITEWTTYLGVMLYKCVTTFLPFFLMVIILGLALQSVLMGTAGRWLGTIFVMLGYAFSITPLSLLLGKKFIKSDFKSAANWFPGVYMTLVSLPYLAWNLAVQYSGPSAQDALRIVGDILCLVPPVAFQRGIGAIVAVSTDADDPELTWGTVWSWESRIWFTVVIMLAVGTIEWVYLYHLTTARPPQTRLNDPEEEGAATPVDAKGFGASDEVDRSHVNENGINARELVKLFRIMPPRGSGKKRASSLKSAVKGVSFGVKKNEIFAILGPNGSGKTVTMGMLAGEHTPDYGEIALSGEKLTSQDKSIGHLYHDGNVSYCPQFDALFSRKTVVQHLRFYATVRGLNWKENATEAHIAAIVRLLGLERHKDKMSTDLSGGYKRRLSLGVAMIGTPLCMMVDECTTGIDAQGRHLIWRVLKPQKHDGFDLPAILLSTHYMDEASFLGDRIGILIDGELVAAGSLASLQAEYCRSYFVEIALLHTATDAAQEEVLELFRQHDMPADVYESLPYHFKLQVPFTAQQSSSTSDDNHLHLEQLACIFELLEHHREDAQIKFYSVAQMNLEQIFIDLSRRQFAAQESTRIM